MEYYDSSGYTTENGVKFKFQNNYIMAHRFKEPIFVISDNTLEEVNFDGLAIDTAEHYKEMESEIADLRRQLAEVTAENKRLRIKLGLHSDDDCKCKCTDAWKCAVDQRLDSIACSCPCHSYLTRKAAGGIDG